MRASLDKVLELRVTRSPNNVRCALPPKAPTGGITFTQHGGQRGHLAMNTVTARPPPAASCGLVAARLAAHYADSACDTLVIAFAGYGGGGVAQPRSLLRVLLKGEASHALL